MSANEKAFKTVSRTKDTNNQRQKFPFLTFFTYLLGAQIEGQDDPAADR